MDIESITPLISSLGFPIVVSLYLLVRLESRLDKIKQVISDFNSTLSRML